MHDLNLHLKKLGVSNIYFCAGSRNESLIDYFSDFNLIHHFEERVQSFRALGESKISQKPAAICVTSGTAVAECLPAVIEAFLSHTKLIIITADRPSRLRGTSAPQAIDQTSIFSTYLRSQYIGELSNYSQESFTDYPYQINLEIDDSIILESERTHEVEVLDGEDASKLISNAKNPLLLFCEGSEKYQNLLNQIDKLGVHSYVESLAGLKRSNLKNSIILEKDLLKGLGHKAHEQVYDLIIRFGRTPITKLWRQLDREFIMDILCVGVQKTGLSYGRITDLESEAIFKALSHSQQSNCSDTSCSDLAKLIELNPRSEISLFKEEISGLDPAQSIFYIGNSMPIRYWEMISPRDCIAYANRGANGIDGQLSTAIGIAENTDRHTYCFLGDITLQYDIGALLLKLPENLTIICFQNYGGRIFEQVKVNQEMVQEYNSDLSIDSKLNHIANERVKFIYPDINQTRSFWSEWRR